MLLLGGGGRRVVVVGRTMFRGESSWGPLRAAAEAEIGLLVCWRCPCLVLKVGRAVQLRGSLFSGKRFLLPDKDLGIQWIKEKLIGGDGDC